MLILKDDDLVPGSFYYTPDGAFIYFNRTDVQDAIHAPHIEWEECSSIDVFVGGHDNSLPSAATVLPGVVDRTQNVIIGHGAMDMILYVLSFRRRLKKKGNHSLFRNYWTTI